MSSGLADSVRAALEDVENPVEALARFGRRNVPEYPGERDALCEAASGALESVLGDQARGVAFGVLRGVWGGAPASNGARPTTHGTVRLSDVQPERVAWLWPGRIPLGKLTLLDGDPGLGKSTLTLDLAARLSNGDALPGRTRPDLDDLAGTVLLTAEDGLADTIRPRLDAMGANPERIVALQTVEDRLPTVEDLTAIEAAVGTVGARLVIVDPLMAYLGEEVNSYRDQHVRRALAPLADLAERLGVAVVLVRHLTKGTDTNALYRGGGSIGIIGAARAGLLVAKDPDDETRRILAPTKENLGPPVKALAYRIEGADNGASRIRWEGETAHLADQLLATHSEEERTERDEAKEFLLSELREGPRPAAEILKAASRVGVAERTLRRAKAALDIEAYREGGLGAAGKWHWRLPGKGCHDAGHLKAATRSATLGSGPEICDDRAGEARKGCRPPDAAALGGEDALEAALERDAGVA